MTIKSKFKDIPIPKTNVLTYLFPKDQTLSDEPVWLDSADPSRSLSPRQALSWTKRFAMGLDRLGVGQQEVIMIMSPNHIFVPVIYLGIVGSRRIFSAGNPIYTVPGRLISLWVMQSVRIKLPFFVADRFVELSHQLQNTGAQFIFVHPTMLETAKAAAQKCGLPESKIFLFADRPCEAQGSIRDWRDMLASSEDAQSWSPEPMSPQESEQTIATVNFSSGTTGLPKGVKISHYNLVANTEQHLFVKFHGTDHSLQNHPQERMIGFLPLYHAYGQMWAMLMVVKLKSPIYIMEKFQYDDFLKIIQTYKITHLQVAPPILVMLSKRPETAKYDLSSLQHILCGAAPLSKDLQNDVTRRFGARVTQGWGMTEVTTGALFVPFTVHDDTGSVGQLVCNMECKLVDDNDREVEVGQPGEIVIRGPNICLGYWKNEAATKECLDKDGWLRTGDVAVIDKEERFWIVDRKKELIKVNALQVAPAELEAVLLSHHMVADAAVVGVTIHGEEWPRAYVVIKHEAHGVIKEDDIHAFVNSKVAKHKRFVGGVVFVDEIPKLASGKIVRKIMKAWGKRDAAMLEGQVPARL